MAGSGQEIGLHVIDWSDQIRFNVDLQRPACDCFEHQTCMKRLSRWASFGPS